MGENDVVTQWRQLFQGQEITCETLTEAEGLLDGLRVESPLRFRLATELDEIRALNSAAS
jgi:hypothetical protein